RFLDSRLGPGKPPNPGHRDAFDRQYGPISGGYLLFLGNPGAMKISIWGARGSLASPGQEMARYGGNTSCVQVENGDGSLLILDAGTGIRALGTALRRPPARLDILLTHLHMDHIQGLGFFAPLFDPRVEVH